MDRNRDAVLQALCDLASTMPIQVRDTCLQRILVDPTFDQSDRRKLEECFKNNKNKGDSDQ
jgi:hypothetical protein